MKKHRITDDSRRAIITYAEPSYAGIAISYIRTSSNNHAKVKSKFVLIEEGEHLYKEVCVAMVGDEVEVDENGNIEKICIQSLWNRLKNYCFLLKNHKRKNKSAL